MCFVVRLNLHNAHFVRRKIHILLLDGRKMKLIEIADILKTSNEVLSISYKTNWVCGSSLQGVDPTVSRFLRLITENIGDQNYPSKQNYPY